MAIYSCNIKSVGKKTHATGTAGAHVRYIARDGANADIEAHHIPQNPKAAQNWMNSQEAEERANARMISKIMVALPVELSEPQRHELVRDFVQTLTNDRIPWYFAIHQSGEDAHNPHAHIVLRDRDIETGKRVLMLSDSARDRLKAGLPENGVEWIREKWEHVCNMHLQQAGHEARIDRRSLEAQGVDREPTIHLGTAGQRVEEFAERPQSMEREEKTKLKHYRDEIPYPTIDQGRTRKERNAEIISFNASRIAEMEHSNDNQENNNQPQNQPKQQPELESNRLEEMQQLEKDIALTRNEIKGEHKQPKIEASQEAEPDNPLDPRQQTESEQERLAALEQMEQRIKAFREAQEEEKEEAKRQLEEERSEAREQHKSSNDFDITNSGLRYAQALGQEYDMRDPYGSLARASMAEYGAFAKQQQSLDIQIANATDPEQRQALEIRKEIEVCDYMTITDRRIARMDEVLAGQETEYVKQIRCRADGFEERAKDLHEEYRELKQQQHERHEDKSPDELDKERIEQRQEAWEQQREKGRNTPSPDIDRDL
jgi:hypothetical protein